MFFFGKLLSCATMRTVAFVVFTFAISLSATSNGYYNSLFATAHPLAPSEQQVEAAKGVIRRLLGNDAVDRFAFSIQDISSAEEKQAPSSSDIFRGEFFHVNAANGLVTVVGTSGVALCTGAYQYLKQALGVSVTWGEDGSGDQIDTAMRFISLNEPFPNFKLERTAMVPLRYAWNMCTFSYTAPWWNETRWQREVDWMALHGINMPLAVTGVEYVWKKVYVDTFKVSLSDLQEWFSGPAFLTWQRMGNVRSFGGPLSLQWINRQKDLSVFILQEMRSLGMRPVLSCFAGHVPAAAKLIFSDEADKFHRSPNWLGFPNEFTGVWHVEPTAKAYKAIGEAFMAAQKEVYGEADFFNCDTYNEVDPISDKPEALAASSSAVVSAIRSTEPTGVWVMQAWLFFFSGYWRVPGRIKHYLSGAKRDEMIILDLNADQVVIADQHRGPKENNQFEFYGHRWIWNMLQNFGGVHDVYGDLHRHYNNLPRRILSEWGNCVGIGLTAEAVEHNAMLYEGFTDLFFNGHAREKNAFLSVAEGGGAQENDSPRWMFIPKGQRLLHLDEWAHEYSLQRHGAYAPPSFKLLNASGLTPETLFSLQTHASELGKVLTQVFYTGNEGSTFLRTVLDHNPIYPVRRINAPFTRSVARLPGALHGIRLALKIARITDRNPFGGIHRPIHTDMIDLTFVSAHAIFEIKYDLFAQLLLAPETDVGKGIVHKLQSERRFSFASIQSLNRSLINIYYDLDDLASSNPNFMLGRWVNSARNLAFDLGPTNKALLDDASTSNEIKNLFTPEALKKEADLYDYNARNLVTIWAPRSGMALESYARRMWGGIFKDFYAMRQTLMLSMLAEERSVGVGEKSASPPNQRVRAMYDELRKRSTAWVSEGSSRPTEQYSDQPICGRGREDGFDTVELARRFVRQNIMISHEELGESFEGARLRNTAQPPPTASTVESELSVGVWRVEIPNAAAHLPQVMGHLCKVAIGPSCIGFDTAQGVLFVRLFAPTTTAGSPDDLSKAAAVFLTKDDVNDGGDNASNKQTLYVARGLL